MIDDIIQEAQAIRRLCDDWTEEQCVAMAKSMLRIRIEAIRLGLADA
jgi:hypothetical protein